MPVPSGLFAGDAPHEPCHVDDEALVRAFTHTFLFVVGLHPEYQSTPITPGKGRPEDDPHADRSGRQVTDVDVRPHRPLAQLESWQGKLVGGELEVAHKHRGRQDPDPGVAEPGRPSSTRPP
jgi:hypothetical protein